MDDTELGTQEFQDFHEGQYSSTVCRNPKPANSKSWGIPEFCKTVNGFPWIPAKIYRISEKFMPDFQSGSLSIYYRISKVVHWGGGGCEYFLEFYRLI